MTAKATFDRRRDRRGAELTLACFALIWACTATVDDVAASIIEISIPTGSQNPHSRPAYDNVWSVVAQNGVLDINQGIGIIVNPSLPADVFDQFTREYNFAMHQNDTYHAYVPDPVNNTITFTFDTPTVVKGVEIIQHVLGVTKIGGQLGNSVSSLSSLGSVFGPLGDVVDQILGPDLTSHIFDFGNVTQAGTVFNLTVDKTTGSLAYAFYRAFLLDENGQRIAAINEPASEMPEPASVALLGLALAGLGWSRRRK